MRLFRLVGLTWLFTLSLFATAQTPNSSNTKDSAVAFVRDVTVLISKHFPDKPSLRASADHLAKTYSKQLAHISKKVDWVVTESKTKFADMHWQEKLNLALELWRVRSSLDLMCLLSPEVFRDLTGMDPPELKGLMSRFTAAEAEIEQVLPLWKR